MGGLEKLFVQTTCRRRQTNTHACKPLRDSSTVVGGALNEMAGLQVSAVALGRVGEPLRPLPLSPLTALVRHLSIAVAGYNGGPCFSQNLDQHLSTEQVPARSRVQHAAVLCF
jgi:hypothetical protein